MSAYQELNGTPPDSQDALVRAGLLDQPVQDFEVRADGGAAVVVGTGVCTGS